MSAVILGTNVVSKDEPCLWLMEIDRPTPDSKGVHRYQVLSVVRGDRPVRYEQDLGPTENFKVDPVVLPGSLYDERTGKTTVIETVGRLMELAEKRRSNYYKQPVPSEKDLVSAYHDGHAKLRLIRKRISTFGPLARIQRD